MSIQVTMLLQAIIFITFLTILIRLVMAVFKIAKTLQDIDQKLLHIQQSLDKKQQQN